MLSWRKPSSICMDTALSVVIPCARPDFRLRCCLEALANQSTPACSYEVILVLDGVSLPIGLREACNRIENLSITQTRHCRGRSATRNVGLKLATAPTVVLLDADMIPCPTLLQEYKRASQSPKQVVCIGDRVFVEPYKRMRATSTLDFLEMKARCSAKVDWRLDKIYRKTRNLESASEPFWAFLTGNCSFPRELGIEIGGFDEAMKGWGLEDQEFGYRLWKTGRHRFIRLPDALALHIEHPRDLWAEWRSHWRNRRYMLAKHGDVFARWKKAK